MRPTFFQTSCSDFIAKRTPEMWLVMYLKTEDSRILTHDIHFCQSASSGQTSETILAGRFRRTANELACETYPRARRGAVTYDTTYSTTCTAILCRLPKSNTLLQLSVSTVYSHAHACLCTSTYPEDKSSSLTRVAVKYAATGWSEVLRSARG